MSAATLTAHTISAGGPRSIVCGDCVRDIFEANVSTSNLTTAVLSIQDVESLRFPSCDSCEVSFVPMLSEVSK